MIRLKSSGAWARRRTVRIAALKFAIALLGAGAIYATFWTVAHVWPESPLGRFADQFLKAGRKGSEVLNALGIGLVATIFFIAQSSLEVAGKISEWLHDRFLLTFNTDVLRPIGPPRPLDPVWGIKGNALPWIVGARRAAQWESLRDFVRLEKSGEDQVDRFQACVLTGPSGSGKTRAAVELARHLARAADDPRAPAGRPGPVPDDPAPRPSRIGAWWRSAARPSRWRQDDPWHAGRLFYGAGEGGWDEQRRTTTAWRKALAAWRPARPTLLLLDDKEHDESQYVLETLADNAASFRHPVRLLITMQVLARTLGLERDAGSWRSGLDAIGSRVVALRGADFEEADIDALWPLLSLRGRCPEPTRRAIMRATRGNPLLVELAFDHVRLGRDLEGLTAPGLLEARAKRIRYALGTAGLGGDAALKLLAVATLAGGLRIPGGLPGIAWAEAGLNRDTLPLDGVSRVFSLDPGRVDLVPAVRPERVGDAFVRKVIEQLAATDPGAADDIVAAAWSAAPATMVRATARLSRRDDELGRAMAAIDVGATGAGPLALALAFAEAACLVPVEDWNLPRTDDGWSNCGRAMGFVAAIPPAEAVEVLERIAEWTRADPQGGVFRLPPAEHVFAAAARRAIPFAGGGDAGAERALRAFVTFVTAPSAYHGLHDPVIEPDIEVLARALAERFPAGHPGWTPAIARFDIDSGTYVASLMRPVVAAGGMAWQAPPRRDLFALMEATSGSTAWILLQLAGARSEAERAWALSVLVRAQAVAGALPEAGRTLRRLRHLARRDLRPDGDLALALVRGYSGFFDSGDALAPKRARLAEALLRHFEGEPGRILGLRTRFLMAATLRTVAFTWATAGQAERCTVAVGQVGGLLDGCKLDGCKNDAADIALLRCQAYRAVVHVVGLHGQDAELLSAARRDAEATIDPSWTGIYMFEAERASIHTRIAAFHHRHGEAAETVKAARRVEAIVHPDFSLSSTAQENYLVAVLREMAMLARNGDLAGAAGAVDRADALTKDVSLQDENVASRWAELHTNLIRFLRPASGVQADALRRRLRRRLPPGITKLPRIATMLNDVDPPTPYSPGLGSGYAVQLSSYPGAIPFTAPVPAPSPPPLGG